MIRVLIVDDDKLVRKGLISSMPWATFDMTVVGEANNGETALRFLEENEVDLMMVDLAMPVMSGIELMRIVSQRYSQIQFVVLTFHQDFIYIQEALRLGAADYIAKEQLEKERFDEILQRISELIQRNKQKNRSLLPDALSQTYLSDLGIVLISTEEYPDTQWMLDLNFGAVQSEEIANRLWMFIPGKNADAENAIADLSRLIEKRGKWVILKLSGLQGQQRSSVHHILRKYRETVFFYERDTNANQIVKTLTEISDRPPSISDEQMAAIKEHWLRMEWVVRPGLFAQAVDELSESRIPVSRIIPMLSIVGHELSRLCAAIKPLRIDPVEKVTSWYELEIWLKELQQQAYLALVRQHYSDEVTGCVFQAVKIIQDELDHELTAAEIASRVNMSRSYFNQCFKNISGKLFNDYLRYVRIERAKEYLLNTNQAINRIAEMVGYMDEKYFSQVFRQQTGTLPSDFRKNAQSGLS